jgi:hypothetical protein
MLCVAPALIRVHRVPVPWVNYPPSAGAAPAALPCCSCCPGLLQLLPWLAATAALPCCNCCPGLLHLQVLLAAPSMPQLLLQRSVLLGACVWPAVGSSHEAVQLGCCVLVQHMPAGAAATTNSISTDIRTSSRLVHEGLEIHTLQTEAVSGSMRAAC